MLFNFKRIGLLLFRKSEELKVVTPIKLYSGDLVQFRNRIRSSLIFEGDNYTVYPDIIYEVTHVTQDNKIYVREYGKPKILAESFPTDDVAIFAQKYITIDGQLFVNHDYKVK